MPVLVYHGGFQNQAGVERRAVCVELCVELCEGPREKSRNRKGRAKEGCERVEQACAM